MHRSFLAAVVILSVCLTEARTSHGCSALFMQVGEQPVMARNYDWFIGNALLMQNQPGTAKRALAFDNPAEWTSKYGSVTVNQYGRELPVDGFNQQGLAIAVLWLEATEYPAADERPSVSPARWVQYQLDTSSTVAEVLQSDNVIRINPYGDAKVHYFVSDATGDCAVIEFLEGRLVAHRGDSLRLRQITNSTCQASQEGIASYEGFGGTQTIPQGSRSLSRYARLASVVQKLNSNPVEAESDAPRRKLHEVAFDTIHQVRQRSTQWQIAYDLKAKKMYFRTPAQPGVRTIELDKCKFDAKSPVKVLDIESPLAGDVVGEFREYTREANKRLVEQSVAGSRFTRNLPAALVQLVIDYPDHSCRPVSTEESSSIASPQPILEPTAP